MYSSHNHAELLKVKRRGIQNLFTSDRWALAVAKASLRLAKATVPSTADHNRLSVSPTQAVHMTAEDIQV